MSNDISNKWLLKKLITTVDLLDNLTVEVKKLQVEVKKLKNPAVLAKAEKEFLKDGTV